MSNKYIIIYPDIVSIKLHNLDQRNALSNIITFM